MNDLIVPPKAVKGKFYLRLDSIIEYSILSLEHIRKDQRRIKLEDVQIFERKVSQVDTNA